MEKHVVGFTSTPINCSIHGHNNTIILVTVTPVDHKILSCKLSLAVTMHTELGS